MRGVSFPYINLGCAKAVEHNCSYGNDKKQVLTMDRLSSSIYCFYAWKVTFSWIFFQGIFIPKQKKNNKKKRRSPFQLENSLEFGT